MKLTWKFTLFGFTTVMGIFVLYLYKYAYFTTQAIEMTERMSFGRVGNMLQVM